jgi:hypothetical protein
MPMSLRVSSALPCFAGFQENVSLLDFRWINRPVAVNCLQLKKNGVETVFLATKKRLCHVDKFQFTDISGYLDWNIRLPLSQACYWFAAIPGFNWYLTVETAKTPSRQTKICRYIWKNMHKDWQIIKNK